MKFQVFKNGKVVFWTTDESCVPSAEEIKELHRAGYKVKTIKDKKKEGETN